MDQKEISADTPKAQFQLYRLYGSLSKRVQIPKLNIPATLTTQMDSQISKDTLFGSEQFSVGGYYSVRGFRENYITGDAGYYFKNKININLGQFLEAFSTKKGKSSNQNIMYKFNIEPFYDYGYVKIKHGNQDKLNSGRLSGAGLKMLFSSKHFNSSLTYSWAVNKSNLITSTEKENKMLYFKISTSM